MKRAHSIALKSFNSNHSLYDQLRPSFQPPVVQKFLKDLNLMNNERVNTDKLILEIAAGTGKFTRNLVDNGWTDKLTVVEPSEGMLKSFVKNFPQVNALQGSSYNIPVADNSIDSVIVAQGFHWFSDLASLHEIKRVLKPSGTFGCIWNFDTSSQAQIINQEDTHISFLFDHNLEELQHKQWDGCDPYVVSNSVMGLHDWSNVVSNYVYTFDTKVPQYRHGKWKDILMNTDLFKPIQAHNFYYYKLIIKLEDVYKYWETRSYITDLSDKEKGDIKNKINQILRKNVTDHDKVASDSGIYLQKIMGTHTITTQPVKENT